jgi:hypothetical protein
MSSWTVRQQEMRSESMQSHADLLIDHIMSTQSMPQIESYLRDAIAKGTHKSHLSVPIWSYWTRTFKMTLAERNEWYDRLADEDKISFNRAERMRNRWAESNGWNWTVSTEHKSSYTYQTRSPLSVNQIVKQTKFLDQLAAEFGEYFTVTAKTSDGFLHSDEFILVRRTSLYLNFFPNRPKWLQTKHDLLNEWKLTRTPKTVLEENESMVISQGTHDFNPEFDMCFECFQEASHAKWCTYHGMPPLEPECPPSPVRFRFHADSYQTPPRIDTRAAYGEHYERAPPAPRNLKKRKICYCCNPEDHESDCDDE